MENIKFFELLRKLDRREFEEFGLFLDSPYHNASAYARRLFTIIKPFYPDFQGSRFTKEAIFKELYPGADYKDKKLRDLFSLTNALAENYLAISLFQQNKLEMESHALKQLGLKDLHKHFEQKAREIENILEKRKMKDDMYFFYRNHMMAERRLYLEFKKTSGKRESFYIELDNEIEQFILFFVSKMLYYYTNQITSVMLLKHEFNIQLIDEIIGYLEEKDLEAYPQINVLRHMVILMRDRSRIDVLDSFEKLLNIPNLKIHRDLLRDGYNVLFNCTKELSMKNVANYNIIYYEILKQMVAKDLLPIENGFMEASAFITFAGEGIAHKDFEWSRNFIEQNYRKLRPEHRENVYRLLMGLLNYGLKNYDKALTLLATVKADDFNMFVRVKLHFIRIYFEKKDYDRVQNEVDAFRHHLNSNKKMPDIYMKRYVTFSSYMTKIITALNSEDYDRLHFIHEEIKAASVFEFRKWMIDQLGQILEEKNTSKNP